MSNQEMLQNIFNEDGKFFIGVCHQNFYGPARGVNAILTKCEPDKIDDFMLSDRHQDICKRFWEKTGMASQVMILPAELIEECETPPQEFSELEDLLDHLEKQVDAAVDMGTDPYYYRLGII